MCEHDERPLPPVLREAARVLRDDAMPPTDIWRQRLLHGVAAASRPTRRAAGWTIRPLTAIAAGLVCMIVGAGAAVIVTADGKADVAAEAATQNARIRFTYDAPSAVTVSLVGDFNGWAAGSLPLRKSADGRLWEVEVPLAPGRYAYSFVVDGRLAPDPTAPRARDDDFGTTNSVVMVRSGS